MLKTKLITQKCPYCLSTKHYKTCMNGLEFIIQHSYIDWSNVDSEEPFIEEIEKEKFNPLLQTLFLHKWEKGRNIFYNIDLYNCDPNLLREGLQETYCYCRCCGGCDFNYHFWELGLIDDKKIYWIWIWYCTDCFSLELEVTER